MGPAGSQVLGAHFLISALSIIPFFNFALKPSSMFFFVPGRRPETPHHQEALKREILKDDI